MGKKINKMVKLVLSQKELKMLANNCMVCKESEGIVFRLKGEVMLKSESMQDSKGR